LRKLAAVFDSLPRPESVEVPDDNRDGKNEEDAENDNGKIASLAQYYERRQKANESKEWGGKRLLLAMVNRLIGGDGTVVYYVFQEGHVKPRQN
jgi:hypothetical protein